MYFGYSPVSDRPFANYFLPVCGLASLSFDLCSFNVKLFASLTSSGSSCLSQPFSSFPSIFAGFLQLHLWSPLDCSHVNVLLVSFSYLCAIWIWLQHGHFSFLYCTFIFVDEFPFSVIHFLKISEWAYHWETSRQCSYTLLWPSANRLRKKWCDWSLVMKCVCYT